MRRRGSTNQSDNSNRSGICDAGPIAALANASLPPISVRPWPPARITSTVRCSATNGSSRWEQASDHLATAQSMSRARPSRTQPGASNHGKCPAPGSTDSDPLGDSSAVACAACPHGIGLPAPAMMWYTHAAGGQTRRDCIKVRGHGLNQTRIGIDREPYRGHLKDVPRIGEVGGPHQPQRLLRFSLCAFPGHRAIVKFSCALTIGSRRPSDHLSFECGSSAVTNNTDRLDHERAGQPARMRSRHPRGKMPTPGMSGEYRPVPPEMIKHRDHIRDRLSHRERALDS